MKVEFYIHGVPYGFSYKGANGEKDAFFKRYYNNLREINEMRIEAVKSNGSNFYYYTYIIGKNVFDGENGRSGAYFGITVRLDQYYTKAQNLYYLLDSFFNSYLLNQIITCANNSYKFLIKEFDNNPTIIQSLKELETLISMNFSAYHLKTLKFNQTNNYARINFADASEDEVQKALTQYGEVSISYSYPSIAMDRYAAQKNEEIKNIQNQHKAEISEISNRANSEVAAARKEKETAINDIRTQYADADRTIQKLEKGLDKEQKKTSRLENELRATQTNLDSANSQLRAEQQRLKTAEHHLKTLETIKAALQDINVQEPKLKQHTPVIKEPIWFILLKMAAKHINTILLLIAVSLLLPLSCGNQSDEKKPQTQETTVVKEKDKTEDKSFLEEVINDIFG